MGNFGRFDRYLEEEDPYGHQARVAQRLMEQRYNQGRYDAGADQRHQELLDRQDRQRAKDDAREQERKDTGMTAYEQELNDKGLLTSDVPYQHDDMVSTPTGMVPKTVSDHLKVRGKVDPATAALLAEAAGQGLIGGDQAWVNSAQNRTALSSLVQGRKAERMAADEKAQAEADTAAKIKAVADDRAAERSARASDSDRDFQHQLALLQAQQEAKAADPTQSLERELMSAEISGKKLSMKRAQDEYLTPQQESSQKQAQALALRAQGGDPEAYHALKMLTADPKVGIDAEVYRPGIEKVLAQPQMVAALKDLHDSIRSNNWSISSEDKRTILGKAQAIISAASDLGPEAATVVKQKIMEALNENGLIFSAAGSDSLRAGAEGL